MVSKWIITPRNIPFKSRWNNPLILTSNGTSKCASQAEAFYLCLEQLWANGDLPGFAIHSMPPWCNDVSTRCIPLGWYNGGNNKNTWDFFFFGGGEGDFERQVVKIHGKHHDFWFWWCTSFYMTCFYQMDLVWLVKKTSSLPKKDKTQFWVCPGRLKFIKISWCWAIRIIFFMGMDRETGRSPEAHLARKRRHGEAALAKTTEATPRAMRMRDLLKLSFIFFFGSLHFFLRCFCSPETFRSRKSEVVAIEMTILKVFMKCLVRCRNWCLTFFHMGEFYSKRGEAIPRKSSYIFVQIFISDTP